MSSVLVDGSIIVTSQLARDIILRGDVSGIYSMCYVCVKNKHVKNLVPMFHSYSMYAYEPVKQVADKALLNCSLFEAMLLPIDMWSFKPPKASNVSKTLTASRDSKLPKAIRANVMISVADTGADLKQYMRRVRKLFTRFNVKIVRPVTAKYDIAHHDPAMHLLLHRRENIGDSIMIYLKIDNHSDTLERIFMIYMFSRILHIQIRRLRGLVYGEIVKACFDLPICSTSLVQIFTTTDSMHIIKLFIDILSFLDFMSVYKNVETIIQNVPLSLFDEIMVRYNFHTFALTGTVSTWDSRDVIPKPSNVVKVANKMFVELLKRKWTVNYTNAGQLLLLMNKILASYNETGKIGEAISVAKKALGKDKPHAIDLKAILRSLYY
jgi:hypothetical protein